MQEMKRGKICSDYRQFVSGGSEIHWQFGCSAIALLPALSFTLLPHGTGAVRPEELDV